MYKKGDKIVYNKDVCLVSDIKVNKYVLVPVFDNSLKITIPVDSPNIRDLITKDEIDSLLLRVNNIELINLQNDKMIENEYKRLIKDGSFESLISVIKTTYLRNKNRVENNKKISEIDNNYFKKTEKILYSEFSVVLNLDLDDTKDYVIKKIEDGLNESN